MPKLTGTQNNLLQETGLPFTWYKRKRHEQEGYASATPSYGGSTSTNTDDNEIFGFGVHTSSSTDDRVIVASEDIPDDFNPIAALLRVKHNLALDNNRPRTRTMSISTRAHGTVAPVQANDLVNQDLALVKAYIQKYAVGSNRNLSQDDAAIMLHLLKQIDLSQAEELKSLLEDQYGQYLLNFGGINWVCADSTPAVHSLVMHCYLSQGFAPVDFKENIHYFFPEDADILGQNMKAFVSLSNFEFQGNGKGRKAITPEHKANELKAYLKVAYNLSSDPSDLHPYIFGALTYAISQNKLEETQKIITLAKDIGYEKILQNENLYSYLDEQTKKELGLDDNFEPLYLVTLAAFADVDLELFQLCREVNITEDYTFPEDNAISWLKENGLFDTVERLTSPTDNEILQELIDTIGDQGFSAVDVKRTNNSVTYIFTVDPSKSGDEELELEKKYTVSRERNGSYKVKVKNGTFTFSADDCDNSFEALCKAITESNKSKAKLKHEVSQRQRREASRIDTKAKQAALQQAVEEEEQEQQKEEPSSAPRTRVLGLTGKGWLNIATAPLFGGRWPLVHGYRSLTGAGKNNVRPANSSHSNGFDFDNPTGKDNPLYGVSTLESYLDDTIEQPKKENISFDLDLGHPTGTLTDSEDNVLTINFDNSTCSVTLKLHDRTFQGSPSSERDEYKAIANAWKAYIKQRGKRKDESVTRASLLTPSASDAMASPPDLNAIIDEKHITLTPTDYEYKNFTYNKDGIVIEGTIKESELISLPNSVNNNNNQFGFNTEYVVASTKSNIGSIHINISAESEVEALKQAFEKQIETQKYKEKEDKPGSSPRSKVEGNNTNHQVIYMPGGGIVV